MRKTLKEKFRHLKEILSMAWQEHRDNNPLVWYDRESCLNSEWWLERALLLLIYGIAFDKRGEAYLNKTVGYEKVENGVKYFVFGRNRIRITEHFSKNGKPIELLIENVICHDPPKSSAPRPIKTA